MTLLCLDIGTRTGWAVDTNPVISGNTNWTPKKRKNYIEHPGLRFHEFRKLLTELKNAHNITRIAYERNFFTRGKRTVEVANQFIGVLMAWACHHDIEVIGVATTTLRKSYGNKYKGSEAKLHAKQTASDYYKQVITNDDEADALMLLRFACNPHI